MADIAPPLDLVLGVECIDVLDGFFELRDRSHTLHGDAPVRAVQACPPFAQGSGFGWELRYSGIGLALQADAEPAVQMIDEMTPGFDYSGRINRAADLGYLKEPQLSQLQDNWWWRDQHNPQQIHLWTGLLVKPGPGCHLRLTELFNSPHLQLNIHQDFLRNDQGWAPLILRFELRGVDRSAIAGTVASLSPLPTNSRLLQTTLSDYPWVGQRVIDYYSPSYYERKLSAPPTRAYAKLIRSKTEQPPWLASHAEQQALAVAASPEDAETISCSSWPEASGTMYAELRTPADIRLLYLGRSFDPSMGDGWGQIYQRTRAVWEQLYGAPGARYLDDATFDGTSCAHPTSGHPVLVMNIEPLVRFVTRPGWSLVFEGSSQTLPWGLRGVIASDQFHSGALAFQCFETPQSQIIEQGSLLGKVIPVPNALLSASFQLHPLPL